MKFIGMILMCFVDLIFQGNFLGAHPSFVNVTLWSMILIFSFCSHEILRLQIASTKYLKKSH